MKEITELKANKHSIPSKNMTSNRFLKELASEDYGGLSGLRGITFKECPTCSGMGEVDDKFNLPYNRKFLEQNPDIEFGLPKECPDCGGKGQISEIDFGESKARETDADIAQAEADRVCPICGEKSPYIRMGDFWEKHFANNHTSYGFEPQSGESIAREDSSSNWFRPEDKNPKDNPSGMFIIDDDDDDDDIFDAMRRERYFQQDLDDEIGFNDDAAEANGRSVAQIKKDIKKMQEFIRVASLENPMNMGEWNSELEGLKAELASATESKKQIISKLQESNSMCRDCMNNFLAKASESIAFEEGIREECHDWRGFEIDCDSHKIIGKGYSSDKDWEDGKHLGQDWKTF